MTRKRLHKLLMSYGFSRDEANIYINAGHEFGYTNKEIIEFPPMPPLLDEGIEVIRTSFGYFNDLKGE